MSRCIDKLSARQKQWLWFVLLWCGGLLGVFALSGLIKLLMPA